MMQRPLDCLAGPDEAAMVVHAIRPCGLDALLERLDPVASGFLRACGFTARAGAVQLLPSGHGAGLSGAVLGLGDSHGPWSFGALPSALSSGGTWQIERDDGGCMEEAVLGFCLGAYRFESLRRTVTARCGTRSTPAMAPTGETSRRPIRLVTPAGCEAALSAAQAAWLTRDLINLPANLLGPEELAAAAAEIAGSFGASCELVRGEALSLRFPAVEAVGAGSARPPVVAVLRWSGSKAGEDAPLVSLCGKGVVFDSGGLDLKPASGMLRMKKDMGGAATLLGLARMVMAADLPVRLALRLGCVENSVSGMAMRPLDVLHTRSGLSVEVGNTDAEGRLVLCDLLAEACEETPALLVDAATLTGAARTALGPDLPALFSNDDALADAILSGGHACHDPLWRLPLWPGYDSWLDSKVSDLCNVSGKPMAGAIVAALFLQHFVMPGLRWAHLDLYAWNDAGRPGRPEGGEAQAQRALFHAISQIVHAKDRIGPQS